MMAEMKKQQQPSMKVLEGEVKVFALKLENKYIKRKIKIREEKKFWRISPGNLAYK